MLSCQIIGIAKKSLVTNFNSPDGAFIQLKYYSQFGTNSLVLIFVDVIVVSDNQENGYQAILDNDYFNHLVILV